MKYCISLIVSCVVLLLSKIALDHKISNKIALFAIKHNEDEYISKSFASFWQWTISVLLMLVTFFSMLEIQSKVFSALGIIKMAISTICMIGAACFDLREHRIPNFFPAFLAISALILLALGFILDETSAIAYVVSSGFAAIGCVVFLLVASALTKGGIGAGDIKLIGALALMSGVYTIIGTLFFGVVSCSVTTLVALILKKKKMSSAVPFGPFLLLGYIVTLFLVNF